MAIAAVAPWPLGLTGWIYGFRRRARRVFVAMAFAVAGNPATEPSRMGPEKRLFAFSIFYLFALFAALVADRWLLPMTRTPSARNPDRDHPRPPARARRIMAWLLGAFVVLLFLITLPRSDMGK
jgi:hypothetical protein